ncbi:hypothetical protein P3T76_009380 [Phytophthora citrophthora]|uniref:Uncharacterized protein n=1 Tax=Phytophthora citrophthora TaxID=4793 RepID=A0AAD9GGJ5_9STRA|nr:hypothetical protein P3T76_009380 [Phytophthora citrophthora]
MYIGPWQEYRLAKIQDDAIQRLRQEFEAQLRGQLPPRDDDCIRELMQPLMAKMPSLLLAAKTRTSGSSTGMRNGRSTGSRSSLSSETSSRCSSRPASARSNISTESVRTRTSNASTRGNGEVTHRHSKSNGNSNQETHDKIPSRGSFKPPRPKKKGKKTQLTALEQVQKRKKMFATWIKQAGDGSGDKPEQEPQETGPEVKETVVTRLPPIHSAVPTSAAMILAHDTHSKLSSSLALPPLHQCSKSIEKPSNTIQAVAVSTRTSDGDATDLDESVDEEEINKLLSWTDTLLSPHALDSLCNFDD